MSIDARTGSLQLFVSPAWMLGSEPVIAGAGFAQGQGVLLSEPVAINSPMWGSGIPWITHYPSEPWDRWTRVLSRAPFRRPDPDSPYAPDPARGFWADHAVWTDGIVWTDHAVWTDGIVWTNGIVWTDHAVWTD